MQESNVQWAGIPQSDISAEDSKVFLEEGENVALLGKFLPVEESVGTQ